MIHIFSVLFTTVLFFNIPAYANGKEASRSHPLMLFPKGLSAHLEADFGKRFGSPYSFKDSLPKKIVPLEVENEYRHHSIFIHSEIQLSFHGRKMNLPIVQTPNNLWMIFSDEYACPDLGNKWHYPTVDQLEEITTSFQYTPSQYGLTENARDNFDRVFNILQISSKSLILLQPETFQEKSLPWVQRTAWSIESGTITHFKLTDLEKVTTFNNFGLSLQDTEKVAMICVMKNSQLPLAD